MLLSGSDLLRADHLEALLILEFVFFVPRLRGALSICRGRYERVRFLEMAVKETNLSFLYCLESDLVSLSIW
jgi:hypothetical protein